MTTARRAPPAADSGRGACELAARSPRSVCSLACAAPDGRGSYCVRCPLVGVDTWQVCHSLSARPCRHAAGSDEDQCGKFRMQKEIRSVCHCEVTFARKRVRPAGPEPEDAESHTELVPAPFNRSFTITLLVHSMVTTQPLETEPSSSMNSSSAHVHAKQRWNLVQVIKNSGTLTFDPELLRAKRRGDAKSAAS